MTSKVPFLKLISESEEGCQGERERDIDSNLLFHLFMHLLVDSYMCPDQGLNLRPWHIGMVFKPISYLRS